MHILAAIAAALLATATVDATSLHMSAQTEGAGSKEYDRLNDTFSIEHACKYVKEPPGKEGEGCLALIDMTGNGRVSRTELSVYNFGVADWDKDGLVEKSDLISWVEWYEEKNDL